MRWVLAAAAAVAWAGAAQAQDARASIIEMLQSNGCAMPEPDLEAEAERLGIDPLSPDWDAMAEAGELAIEERADGPDLIRLADSLCTDAAGSDGAASVPATHDPQAVLALLRAWAGNGRALPLAALLGLNPALAAAAAERLAAPGIGAASVSADGATADLNQGLCRSVAASEMPARAFADLATLLPAAGCKVPDPFRWMHDLSDGDRDVLTHAFVGAGVLEDPGTGSLTAPACVPEPVAALDPARAAAEALAYMVWAGCQLGSTELIDAVAQQGFDRP